jgi:hypothetical protein
MSLNQLKCPKNEFVIPSGLTKSTNLSQQALQLLADFVRPLEWS